MPQSTSSDLKSALQDTQNPTRKTRVSGVILIDKPQGLTSQQVVSKVKYLFKSPNHDSKKAGHTGTLDPMATGLLPVCLGEATKYSHYQLDADKSYQATVTLGVQTDTGDAEGHTVASKAVPTFDQTILDNIAAEFTGDIKQIPPMYSALKKDGKKLYEYARAGIEVERPARSITIKQLTIAKSNSLDEIQLTVTCSKGTYIRVFGEDIAHALGTVGHLTQLRRTHVGHFDINDAIRLEDLENLELSKRFEQLLGIDSCIDTLPVLTVTDTQCQRLHLGQRLNVKEALTHKLTAYIQQHANNNTDRNSSSSNNNSNDSSPTCACDIRLYSERGEFVGLGHLAANGRLQPKKMIQRS